MTYQDHLLRKAQRYWDMGERLPLDLFSELLSAGINVAEAEEQSKYITMEDN